MRYVLELARALSEHPEVGQVELLTRQLEDPELSPDYAVNIEPLSSKARILRLPFGPRRYFARSAHGIIWTHSWIAFYGTFVPKDEFRMSSTPITPTRAM